MYNKIIEQEAKINFIEAIEYLDNNPKHKIYRYDKANELYLNCSYPKIRNRWGHTLDIRTYDVEAEYVICDYIKIEKKYSGKSNWESIYHYLK